MQDSTHSSALFLGLGLIGLLFALAVALAIYIFFCYCSKRICEKCGHEPGVLIWIPIVNLVPLLTAAGLPVWFIILFFVPFVNVFVGIWMWWKICEKRQKPGPLALVLLIPPIGLFLLPYLAFAD